MVNNFYVYYLIDPNTRQPFYVGKGTGNRMYEHYRVRSRLTNPLLKNKLLKMDKEGKTVVYEKVLINADEEMAFAKERALISLHGRLIDRTGILCNLTEGGEGNSACWTDERKQKQRDRMKGKRGNLPIKQKPVSQYTLDGEWIADFASAKEASHHVPAANSSYLAAVCKGKRKSAGGFLWAYKDAPSPTFTKKYHRAVRQYDTNGTLITEYKSLTEAQNRTGVELHNISEACRGKSKTAGGFRWSYSCFSSS